MLENFESNEQPPYNKLFSLWNNDADVHLLLRLISIIKK